MALPLFEVVTPAANAAARRLCSVAAVTSIMDEGDIPSDSAETEAAIDAVSAQMAREVDLAADATNVPTFAQETLRATWFKGCDRGQYLSLPWRVPVSSITSVVEDGVTLTTGTDYRLLSRGKVLRLENDGETPTCWSSEKIVIVYVGGWAATLSETAPVELSTACAEQVKYKILTKSANPGLRSYTVNDLRSETFNVPGGDSISKSGLLVQVDAALAPYRTVSV